MSSRYRGDERPVAAGASVAVQGVHKAFTSDRIVLRDLDLTVAAGEVVCLIGASGSGKSTLLRCINGLESVDAGRIFIDDLEVSAVDADLNAVRRRVGIVFQNFNLFPHMSVLRNVTLAPTRVHGVPKTQAEDKALELLTRFGLRDKAHEHPDRLSGGQQQRVAIVRALACEPQVMLFDEITSALDPQLVGEVLEAVSDLAHSGMTILMATHEMSFARDVSDRICFLDGGRVLEEGPPEQIFTAPVQPRTQEFLARALKP